MTLVKQWKCGSNKSEVSMLKYKMNVCLHFIAAEMAVQIARPFAVWLTLTQSWTKGREKKRLSQEALSCEMQGLVCFLALVFCCSLVPFPLRCWGRTQGPFPLGRLSTTGTRVQRCFDFQRGSNMSGIISQLTVPALGWVLLPPPGWELPACLKMERSQSANGDSSIDLSKFYLF